jgi:hypothetical protein
MGATYAVATTRDARKLCITPPAVAGALVRRPQGDPLCDSLESNEGDQGSSSVAPLSRSPWWLAALGVDGFFLFKHGDELLDPPATGLGPLGGLDAIQDGVAVLAA